MRYLLFIIILPFFVFSQSSPMEDEDQGWFKDYDTALSTAKKEDKNVLIYFTGSDWCAPCKMLKKDLFDTAEFAMVADKYVLLYIDIPRNRDLLSSTQWKHNQGILSKLNKKGTFPLLKVLNTKGKVLDEYSGYSMTGEIGYHMKLLNKHK